MISAMELAKTYKSTTVEEMGVDKDVINVLSSMYDSSLFDDESLKKYAIYDRVCKLSYDSYAAMIEYLKISRYFGTLNEEETKEVQLKTIKVIGPIHIACLKQDVLLLKMKNRK